MQSRVRRFSATLLLCALAGCGGGGGGSFIAPPTSTGSGSTTSIPFSVKISAKAAPQSSTRKPADLSASTQSIAVYAYSQGSSKPSTASGTFNVAAGASGCTQNSDGSLTCTFNVNGPSGNDTITLVAYSGSNGSGNVLSQATITVNATPNMTPVSVTTNTASVAQIRLTPETPVFASGTAGTSKIDVNAYDPSGNLILGSTSFASPVTLSSDSSAVTVPTSPVTTPGAQITATYTGANSAPYAVHVSASAGTTVAANMIVGATLNIVPSQSFAVLGGYGSQPVYATYATTASNEPPQSFNPLNAIASSQNPMLIGFAALPNGSFAVSSYTNNTCSISIVSGSSRVAQTTVPGSGCPVAGAGAGIAVLDGTTSPQLETFSVSGSNLTSTGTLALNSTSLPAGVNGISNIAADVTGDIAMVGNTASGYALVLLPFGSTTITQLATFPVPSGFSPSVVKGLAFSPDGTHISVLIDNYGGTSASFYAINTFATSGGALTGSIMSPSCAASTFCGAAGIGIDKAGEIMVAENSYPQSGPEAHIDVYAPGATAPSRTIVLSGAGRMTTGLQSGPVFTNGPSVSTPTTTSVSGDMMGYQASRTWTYRVTPADPTIAPYVVGMYADPQPVNGNERFVGYLPASGSTNPFTGTKVGSMDLLATQGAYQAEAFSSVSSGTNGISGSVPGAPLFVPNTLGINQTWNPLQNMPIAAFAGITASAQVLSVGSAADASACPSGSGTTAATVQYTVSGAGAFTVSYVPGCGIVSLVADDGSRIDLTAVGSQSSLGQQIVPAGQPAIVGALHALWQHTLHKPH